LTSQVKRVFCESSGALVPKDKAVKRFMVRNIVESAAIRDLQESCAFESYTLPKLYRKAYYSISAAIHSKVVRVRSREARRIREPPRRFRANTDKKDKKP
jgi:small subunit ribosomal protein S26e